MTVLRLIREPMVVDELYMVVAGEKTLKRS